jgi:hypothetical protein
MRIFKYEQVRVEVQTERGRLTDSSRKLAILDVFVIGLVSDLRQAEGPRPRCVSSSVGVALKRCRCRRASWLVEKVRDGQMRVRFSISNSPWPTIVSDREMPIPLGETLNLKQRRPCLVLGGCVEHDIFL